MSLHLSVAAAFGMMLVDTLILANWFSPLSVTSGCVPCLLWAVLKLFSCSHNCACSREWMTLFPLEGEQMVHHGKCSFSPTWWWILTDRGINSYSVRSYVGRNFWILLMLAVLGVIQQIHSIASNGIESQNTIIFTTATVYYFPIKLHFCTHLPMFHISKESQFLHFYKCQY